MPARADALELTFVGDVIFGRYRESGYDPIPEEGNPVFDEIKTQLAADVVVGNLETPLVRSLPEGSPIGSRYRFGASLDMAKHLQRGGFTVMSLANNHWFDQRLDGIEQTPVLLQELGIVGLGAARRDAPVFRVETVEAKGWRVGFVAITTRTNAPVREGMPVLPYLETDRIDEDVAPVVREARANHDLVIVVVHWGEEYAEAPNSAQVRGAHALIDAGADLVIGHHPHVLQGIERHGDGLIAYSLGNFLFENTNDIPRLTGVLRIKAAGTGPRACLQQVVFHPAYIKRSRGGPHPVPATGGMGKRVRERVITQGKKLGASWTLQGEDLQLDGLGC
ncbi:MAG: CapA family protein [Nannocystaceae bacterium]